MTDNMVISILIGLTISILSLVPLPFLAVMQLSEALQPKDWYTKLKWYLFWLLVVIMFLSVPSIVYLTLRLNGIESETLRNVTTISGNIQKLGVSILLVLIFTYKRKERK